MAEKYTDSERKGAEGGAQIYQDKKGGIPWWVWLILGLLLLGLLLALLNHKNAPAVVTAPQTQTAPAASSAAPATTPNGQPVPPGPPAAAATDTAATDTAATGAAASGKDIKIHSGTDITTAKPAQASKPGVPLSDVVTFAAAADPLTFAGQRAKLTNVPVRKVLTDRAFFVGPSDSQQMLVLLDKGMDAGRSSAAKVTITSGQPVSLVGVVEKLPTAEALAQTYALSGPDVTALQAQKAYLHATVAQQK